VELNEPMNFLCDEFSTFIFALVSVSRSDYGALIVYNHNALHVLVSLHAIERLFDLRHVIFLIIAKINILKIQMLKDSKKPTIFAPAKSHRVFFLA
jgi:hypothetical protein